MAEQQLQIVLLQSRDFSVVHIPPLQPQPESSESAGRLSHPTFRRVYWRAVPTHDGNLMNTSPDDRPSIRLDQFLKLAGAVGSGGQAKVLIQQGAVNVNGVVETRRGRKLQPGDVVEFEEESFTVGHGQSPEVN